MSKPLLLFSHTKHLSSPTQLLLLRIQLQQFQTVKYRIEVEAISEDGAREEVEIEAEAREHIVMIVITHTVMTVATLLTKETLMVESRRTDEVLFLPKD